MAGSFRDVELAGWMVRAESYDAFFSMITKQAIPHFLAVLGELPGKAVLDVCCGPGHLAAAAAQRGAYVEGVDFARTIVERATENYPEVLFTEGDAADLPYGDRAFDYVVCAFGVMHLEQPDEAIADAHRVLRPGGIYAFSQWALDDELLELVTTAVAAHGRTEVGLPQAPPLMRFSNPDECRRAMQDVGFRDIRVDRVELEWRTDRAEALLDVIYHGAVRAALLLQAQEPRRRARIHEAIVDAAETRRSASGIIIRRPAVLASGAKS